MSKPIERIDGVNVVCKANVYFDGKVVSHTVLKGDQRQTIGLIYPGSFHFNTAAPERMDIVAGSCRVRIAGAADWQTYGPGSSFNVPGDSGFDIAVDSEIAEYVCTFE